MLFLAGKSRNSRFILLFYTLISVLIFPGRQAEAEEVLSLQEALERALQDNHQIIAFHNSLASQKEDIGIAQSSLMPKLPLSQSSSRFWQCRHPSGLI
jgi:outer membrane protein TolC